MKPKIYKNISAIASRIQLEILSGLGPGDRVPSESQTAKQLGVSVNRVHRAFQMLREDGTVHSTGCRRGMFFTPKLSPSTKTEKNHVKLRFAMRNRLDSMEFQVWKRVCELFQMIEPSVEFELFPGNLNVEADIYLTWPPFFDCSRYRELDLSKIDAVSSMIPEISKMGIQNGKQYSIPVMHSPAVYWAHRNMLRKCGLKLENFQDPLDYIRWGNSLSRMKICPIGYTFYHFSFHSCQWGISMNHDGDYVTIDPEKLHVFFTDLLSVDHTGLIPNSVPFVPMFYRGLLGLMGGYLNMIPLTEKRFQTIGMPLREGGFSGQAVYLAAMGRNTEHEEIVYDFFRFLLSEHIQEKFFLPSVKFSVIDRLYLRQHEQICRETGANIPKFDIRGILSIQDSRLGIVSRYVQDECVYVLSGWKDPDRVIDNIRRIYIPDLEKIWIRDASRRIKEAYFSRPDFLPEENPAG